MYDPVHDIVVVRSTRNRPYLIITNCLTPINISFFELFFEKSCKFSVSGKLPGFRYFKKKTRACSLSRECPEPDALAVPGSLYGILLHGISPDLHCEKRNGLMNNYPPVDLPVA
jgi:hypothetical protein